MYTLRRYSLDTREVAQTCASAVLFADKPIPRGAERYVLHKNKTDARIEDRRWQLFELMGQPVAGNAFLVLDSATDSASGSGSCNSFFGQYRLEPGQRIGFEGLGSTMMACTDMQTETQFFDALERADNYTIVDSILTLNRARMAPLARFRAAVSDHAQPPRHTP